MRNTKAKWEKAKEMYESNQSVKDIVNLLKVSRVAVYRYAQRNGWKRQKEGFLVKLFRRMG